MKLIIGVLGRPKTIDRDITSISRAVTDVIINYDCIPLGIIASVIDVNKSMSKDEITNLHQVIDLCDGIILQGGTDYYQYDLEAIKYIDEKKIPLLGICLGMQSIAVAFGASLKEIPDHQHIGVEYAHPVTINRQSKLYRILGSETIIVNSRHKEAITNPSIIKVVGYSDNVIEAVEKDDNPFMIGVQWHPEDMVRYDKSSQKLFKYFFTCCKSYGRKKNKCDII